MSGHRWPFILSVLLLLTSVGCQTDGGSRMAWNPFRKNADTDAVAEAETPSSFTMPRFSRKKEETADVESNNTMPPMAAEQMERLLSQGRVALQESRLDDAKKAYSDVLASVPDNPTAHHGLAMAADLTEEWDDAEYHYRQALRVRPKDPDLLCDIGYSYLLQNRYSEAERYLTHALEVSPQHESALMNLAMLDLRQGKRNAAEQRLADRYGTSGKANQVLAQLEEQVASMRGGVIPASATAVTAPVNGSVFGPNMTAARGNGAGHGIPEIPANASLEIARREGAETERQRTLQKMGQDSMVSNSNSASPAVPAMNQPQQPNAWPGNTGAMNNAAFNGGAATGANGNYPSTATNAAPNSGPPRSIFGTLQPRSPNLATGDGLNPQATAASNGTSPQNGMPLQSGSPMAGNPMVDPTQWSNSRVLQNSPAAVQNTVSNAGSMANNVIAEGNRAAAGLGNTANSMANSLSGQMANAATMTPVFSGQNPPSGSGTSTASGSNPSHGNSMTANGAGQGTSPASIPNGGSPIAVRSSGAFQPAANAGNSYGMPYGFGSNSGQTPVNTVSNSNSTPMNGQPATSPGAGGTNATRPASQGMYLDGLNVGPGALFPVYPNNSGMNSNGMPSGNSNGSSQPGWPNGSSPNNASMMNGSSPQPGMQPGANMNPGASSANGNPPNGGLRMGNISLPGSGSMINGAMYAQPDSTLPSAGVVSGGGINTTSNLPGWPGTRPAQTNALESYERQRQQLDDEYNRTLEQLDRNSPTSSSRAQY